MIGLLETPGHLIRRLNQISTSIFSTAMESMGYDLTPVQFAALLALSENPGIDQITLSGLIAYDRVTISGVVDRLYQKGLIHRQRSDHDRRAKQLTLSAEGKRIFAETAPLVLAIQDKILEGLTPDERSQLIHLMHKATLAGNEKSRAPMKALTA